MKEKMTPSWNLVKPSALLVREHFEAVIYLFLLPSLLYVLGTLLLGPIANADDLANLSQKQIAGIILSGVAFLYTLINIGPTIYFQIKARAGKTQPVLDYYRGGLRFTLRLFGYYIVFGLLILFGLLLFIVPGFIILRRYILAGYYLVEDDLSIKAAMQRSRAASKPYSGNIWGAIGVQLAITIVASAIGLMSAVGLIFEQLVASLAIFILVLRYREIRAATKVAE